MQTSGTLTVLCGTESFEPTIQLEVEHPAIEIVQNRFLCGRRLLWQSGGIRTLVGARVVVLELNPRILTSWLVLIARRAAGRRTIAWGHAWSRQGEKAAAEPLRHAMRRLAHAIVVYTDTQAVQLRRRMPGKCIVAAPNALYERRMRSVPSKASLPRDVVYCGRLIPAKKPMLLLDAFIAALHALPEEMRLVFVGGGPLDGELRRRVREADVDHRVDLVGPVTDRDALETVYARTLCTVSPGYAGLSLIQSLWFGVPVLVARDEPHSPEIEAVEEGVNAVIVDSDSIAALGDGIIRFARDREEWVSRRPAIAAACCERYSIERMVSSIVGVL